MPIVHFLIFLILFISFDSDSFEALPGASKMNAGMTILQDNFFHQGSAISDGDRVCAEVCFGRAAVTASFLEGLDDYHLIGYLEIAPKKVNPNSKWSYHIAPVFRNFNKKKTVVADPIYGFSEPDVWAKRVVGFDVGNDQAIYNFVPPEEIPGRVNLEHIYDKTIIEIENLLNNYTAPTEFTEEFNRMAWKLFYASLKFKELEAGFPKEASSGEIWYETIQQVETAVNGLGMGETKQAYQTLINREYPIEYARHIAPIVGCGEIPASSCCIIL